VGIIIPIIILKVVVLPAPFRPSRPTMLRCAIVMDTPLTTALPEYFFTNPPASSKFVSVKIFPFEVLVVLLPLPAYYSDDSHQSNHIASQQKPPYLSRGFSLNHEKATNNLAF
jgi:hypothetical protein